VSEQAVVERVKHCPKCREVKEVTSNGYCKACVCAYSKEWQAKNPERHKRNRMNANLKAASGSRWPTTRRCSPSRVAAARSVGPSRATARAAACMSTMTTDEGHQGAAVPALQLRRGRSRRQITRLAKAIEYLNRG